MEDHPGSHDLVREGDVAATDQELFDELTLDTLARGDAAFIHQNCVDAFAAQHADMETKPIKVVFAVMGLYLHLEKGFTGRQVQRAHVRMARQRRVWPQIPVPAARAEITVADVMGTARGAERDAMIERWCAAVWEAWQGERGAIVSLARSELGVQ